MIDDKPILYDLDSYDIVTDALMKLLNSYPDLKSTEKIKFCDLGTDKGKAIFPISAPVISGKPDILGYADCLYTFAVYNKLKPTSELQRIKAKEWLENLGKWLEKREIDINGTVYKLDSYPTLTGEREFTSVKRDTSATIFEVADDKTETWVITITAMYETNVNN